MGAGEDGKREKQRTKDICDAKTEGCVRNVRQKIEAGTRIGLILSLGRDDTGKSQYFLQVMKLKNIGLS